MLNRMKKFLRYIIGSIILKVYPIKVDIMTIDETIDYISSPGNSMVRFGDGEFSLINKQHIDGYQKSNNLLAKELINVVSNINNPRLLICVPEPLKGVSKYVCSSRWHWTAHIAKNRQIYKELCSTDFKYGNAFISRPYMIYKNKEQSKKWFERIINIWDGRDVVIIEGEYSRSGVGNDLFNNVKSLHRIICPAQNAFDKYDDILREAFKLDKKNLILLALGPTSKPLAKILVDNGYWVLDIGHLDCEYEWYRGNQTSKVKIKNKHSAEILDDKIEECNDTNYLKSIIAVIE